MPIDQEKLAKLQKLSANNKVGGTRRKFAKKTGTSSKDDSKLQDQLQKLRAVTVDNVQQANFFKDDGSVLHFSKVGVQVAPQHNTSVFYGIPQEKSLQELFPDIIPQMGAEAINALTQMASQMQSAQGAAPEGADAAAEGKDVDIPELVDGQTFEADVE
ncbi:unnamed protein product [Kluyveromyces dobzhanskii CBS 2104]|uniref:Nascent polypeptide-associated complex subunit beta n=1 Tax=Kluyveromyces dobzhanskii CBS 2104 TaxID=1427455 RepID=A0A0A8L4L8_9SACH|nr:unnamed protein product [Kluyveromyces dobzhanskii CBS 2104]